MHARHAVTGAFGFSGRHIATRLLARGDEVLNLTNHPKRPDPFAGRVPVAPLVFTDDKSLAGSLRGIDVLFNTYWFRVPKAGETHDDAVRNLGVLFAAARRAGVRRIVHISVANPDAQSPHSYYRGKARAEEALAASGVGHAVLRPAVLFGDEPILVNTVAWLLRRVPLFAIPGDGRYPIQPVSVNDVADLALAAAALDENVAWDAAGPETMSFTEFIRAVRSAVGSRALVVHVPALLALLGARGLGLVTSTMLLTAEELDAMTAGLLASHEPPRGTTRFSEWLAASGTWLGRQRVPRVVHRN
jgi:NADH dehydrogenase